MDIYSAAYYGLIFGFIGGFGLGIFFYSKI
ncbi:MAG: hypothetical protein AMQ22_00002 [Candidatus Methanofastidiosum methylothiophilum]|uniref:Uncharacterized protein n=1 Tax=Candidatus Methanofastidiosum methylothiophilum TaxID=1705564 RepID=A0A150J961_9EURY|nr:MAG: hypothetical protein AMQ22_00002 [Candidatus Methanofastidiosum methylthiophilus]